jgi:hypothetical protein
LVKHHTVGPVFGSSAPHPLGEGFLRMGVYQKSAFDGPSEMFFLGQ